MKTGDKETKTFHLSKRKQLTPLTNFFFKDND